MDDDHETREVTLEVKYDTPNPQIFGESRLG